MERRWGRRRGRLLAGRHRGQTQRQDQQNGNAQRQSHVLQLHSSLALRNSLQRGERLLGQMIGLGVGRIAPGLDIVFESHQGVADHGCHVGIAANELGWRRERQSQQIVEDQHLPIAFGAGADADGRNLQLAR